MSALDNAAKAIEDWFDFPDHKEVVRAVLMAVREPDEETGEAGARAVEHDVSRYGAQEVFTAIIDVILAEGTENAKTAAAD